MRRYGAALSLVVGCGRIGFDVCAMGCGGNGGGAIERVAVAAPGASSDITATAQFQMTAGDVVIAAHYSAGIDNGPVTDDLGGSWATLPLEKANCSSPSTLRLYWQVAPRDGLATILAQGSTVSERGLFVVSFRGVASLPIDVSAGNDSGLRASFDAGTLITNDDDHILAVFIAKYGSPLQPGPGLRQLAQDNSFSALMADMPGPEGTYTPSAMAVDAPDCWAGTSLALLPK